MRVLVVDDDEAVCRTASWAIEQVAECDAAPDVASACALLERGHFDLVLIDVRLPGASGLNLLDTVRARWPATAALMISGLDDLAVAQDALARGAVAYVVKPFRVNDLRIHVASALALTRRSPAAAVASARVRVDRALDDVMHTETPRTCCVVEVDQPSLLEATYGPGALADVQHHLEARLQALPARVELLGELRPGVVAAALFVDPVADPADAARRLYRHLSRPVVVDERTLPSAVRIGFAACDENEEASTILSRAEEAAACAQEQNLPFAFAEETRRLLARDHLDLLADLRLAIDAQRLRVEYQPQVDLQTGRWIGVEALLRWRHPVRGDIPPAVIVPLAERAGFIDLVGAHVLRTACRDLALLAEAGAREDLRVAVNVSTAQLRDDQFLARVSSVLKQTRTSADRLCLEITESLALDESDVIDARLRAIADLGVTLSLDDFGTGYSSFSLLQRAPWGEIKIDRSITALLAEPSAIAIVRSVIALGNARGLDVLAEGVESEHQSTTLRALGCKYAQGYWYARPQPRAAIAALFGYPAAPTDRPGTGLTTS
jgi:EAL domain-containing protein (putative c-di-GMP-specific phosphodiesterase class I)/DNA-binding response OmpR family regulator